MPAGQTERIARGIGLCMLNGRVTELQNERHEALRGLLEKVVFEPSREASAAVAAIEASRRAVAEGALCIGCACSHPDGKCICRDLSEGDALVGCDSYVPRSASFPDPEEDPCA